MNRITTTSRPAEVLQGVDCNRCGQPCPQPFENIPEFAYATLTADSGFGSDKHDDLKKEQSHLCGRCYAEIISVFKVPPTR